MLQRIFDKIDIISIDKLDTGWKVSLKEMSNFVEYCYSENGVLSDLSKRKWAKVIYGDSSPQNLGRLENFVKTGMSIKNEGYFTVLKYNYEFDDTYTGESSRIIVHGIRVSLNGVLPRIRGQNVIDDGRHKLAVLSALGVKRTPVIMIKTVDSDSSGMIIFNLDVVKGIERFKHSEKWKKYMETEDYRKTKYEFHSNEI